MRRLVPGLVLLWGASAFAAGLRDLEDAWLLPPWPMVATDRVAGAAWVGWCAAGSGRLFEMPELPLQGLLVGWGRDSRRALWLMQFSWQVVGAELSRTNRRELRLGRYGAWRIFARLEHEETRLGDRNGPVQTAADLVLGRALDLGGSTHLVGDLYVPLAAPPPAGDRRVRPVARILLGARRAALAAAWDRRGDGTPLLGGELALGLAPSAGLLLRYDGGSGSLGPGLVLRRDNLLLRTSHVVHPVLGVSHRFQLVLGAAPGRWPAPGP